MRFVEVLELPWPSFETAREFDIAAELASSEYLNNLSTLKLPGWDVDVQRLSTLSQANSRCLLQELEIGCRDEDPAELELAFQHFFDSSLGRNLRCLTIYTSSSAEPVCKALEQCSQELQLRVLSIDSNHTPLASLCRLAQARCLRRLWKLHLDGRWNSEEEPGPDAALLASLASLGQGGGLESLFDLQLEDVGQFDASAVMAMLDSPLVARLLVLPEADRFKELWRQSKVIQAFPRSVIESLIRAAAMPDEDRIVLGPGKSDDAAGRNNDVSGDDGPRGVDSGQDSST
jgi:hypothetical protein